ncbi:ATP-binding cassette domain-containing protein [Longimicrobium terrae]|uniref:Phospholipid/cholesterol/gamma-HCH transport system ATP-binding protein n=1 Tax=Longimicrobium terrae TaxID=1639882 RepID=A0A841H1H0_9BACT|nr:phospholipid/cholesterol/gamma-HCH transport system ATP-binding protein [Longimicrobium terrae]MBB6071843.1 phospholipid/cholesterol/gamma-HCH transport system ATP-binding protein [Longimicrobium terrae]
MSIELIDVHKSFGPKQILRGLNLEVKEGQTVSLVGFSGAGKSLTLKHIAGLMTPDRGTIKVDGQNIPTLSRQDLYKLRLDIGYVFQFAALFDSMTIAENLSMGLIKKGGMSASEIRDRVAESLDRVGLSGFQDRYPSEMSGGQQKRAGLARAVAYRPKYLLYDEPTSGLDPVTTEVIDRLILKMKEDLGVTSLVITHDMKSAYNISDRIAMLFEGRVVEEGTPEEFQRSRHPLVRGFVEGRPEVIEEAQRQMAEEAANGGDGHRGHGSQGRHA